MDVGADQDAHGRDGITSRWRRKAGARACRPSPAGRIMPPLMPILDDPTLEFLSHSPEETRRGGVRLGEMLHGGHLVCLEGDLGSGKTTLTQGIARGWGALDSVTSPTFVIINEYHRADAGVLYHVDAFRLGTAEEANAMGLAGVLTQGRGVVLERPPH